MSLPINPRTKKLTEIQFFIASAVLLTCCIGLCVWTLPPTLLGTPSEIDEMYIPAWSADGQSIALECFYNKWEYTVEELKDFELNLGGWYHYQLRDVCIVNKNLQLVQRLTDTGNMHAPAWSSNSQLLAWLEGTNKINIWDSKVDHIKSFISSQPLGYDDFHGDQLVWFQNNSSLYLKGSGVRLDLVIEQFHYLPKQQDSFDICCYAWSFDGNFLAAKQRYESTNDSAYHTVVIYKDNVVISKSNNKADYYSPLAWSPDNTVLAWVSEKETNGYLRYQLSFTWIETGEVFTLDLNDATVAEYPTWSPNGEKLAYSSYSNIHILTLQRQDKTFAYTVSQELILDTHNNHPDSPLVWSPDGQQIAYGISRSDGGVVILSLK